jgi:hypothetical protein
MTDDAPPEEVAFAALQRGGEMFQGLRRELGVESFGINLISLRPDRLARVGTRVRRQLTNPSKEPVVVLALGGSGEHEGRDALAWIDWDEEGPGRGPREIPLPDDLPV